LTRVWDDDVRGREQVTATVEFNPLLPEVIEDPYPFCARLRVEDPVHQSAVGMFRSHGRRAFS
jgi:hypothetical protein